MAHSITWFKSMRCALEAGVILSLLSLLEGCTPATDGPGPRRAGGVEYAGSSRDESYVVLYYYVQYEGVPAYDHARDREHLTHAVEAIRRDLRNDFILQHKWVAVVVFNLGEKGKKEQVYEVFERAHKAGAVFAASDLVDRKVAPAALVSQARTVEKPFAYIDGRQHWLVIEQHRAASAGVQTLPAP